MTSIIVAFHLRLNRTFYQAILEAADDIDIDLQVLCEEACLQGVRHYAQRLDGVSEDDIYGLTVVNTGFDIKVTTEVSHAFLSALTTLPGCPYDRIRRVLANVYNNALSGTVGVPYWTHR